MHLFANARVPVACLPAEFLAGDTPINSLEPWLTCDICIDQDRIVAVRTGDCTVGPWPAEPPPRTDLDHALTWPGLLDVHTHLDKTHTWDRAPNPRGEFWDAIRILRQDALTNWTPEDLHRRASFALESAWAHGTIALRTHLDSGAQFGHDSHALMHDLRQQWAGRINLQFVSLCNLATFMSGEADQVIELSTRFGASAIGGFPQPGPHLDAQLDYLLAAAREAQLGIDLHVDESGLIEAECLRATAEAVIRNDFPYSVTFGHCCSLSVHDDARAADTIRLLQQIDARIISLPLCNLYLQGRKWTEDDRPLSSQWRGLTRLHELMEADLTVACASDNVRDAFFAYGDYDALEVFQASVRVGHLDTRLAAAPAVVTTAAARIMDLPHYGTITPGAPADLVVTAARTFSEFLARPAAPRRLVHHEAFRTAQPPDYRELGASTLQPTNP